jgi:UDP-N-acetylglucosamine 2-epimerase (non-hydrolysing)
VKKIKVATIIGTRPEVIKMAPVIRKLALSERFTSLVCFSGQHRDLANETMQVFAIEPTHNLNLMTPSQGLDALSSLILSHVSNFLGSTQPDLVLVHGDTTTAYMAALASFYAGIPVGHVEAGLRTHNLANPFPEELNRQAIARIARYNFAPTALAKANLVAEGVKESSIYITGNTVVDSMNFLVRTVRSDSKENSDRKKKLKSELGFDYETDSFALLTSHRRESLDGEMEQCFEQVVKLASCHESLRIVFPVHPNPKVQSLALRVFGRNNQVHLIAPLDYVEFLILLDSCEFVITDSGGIQEEAVSLGLHVLVTRDETERPEGLQAGLLRLVGNSGSNLLSAAEAMFDAEARRAKSTFTTGDLRVSPYGDGMAADRILDILIDSRP